MANIKPLGNRVLVKRLKAQTSRGGILLPDSAQEKSKIAEVISVGPGKLNDQGQLIPMEIKPGQKVMFGAYAGTEVKHEGSDDEYLVLTTDDIYGILS